jgi:Muramidase (phage lambda lysozyme)
VTSQPRDSKGRYTKQGQEETTEQDQLAQIQETLYALINSMGADVDKATRKRMGKFLDAQAERTERNHLIKFAIVCGLCAVVSNGSTAIVDGAFNIRHNWQQAQTFMNQCKAKPWDCALGRIKPDFNLGIRPRDNVSAMLSLIAYAEGTGDKYNISYTHQPFTDYSDHPRRLYCSRGICSDAAGRYQFLSTTWDGLRRELNLKDFSPASQDKAAIELMKRCGGYGAAVRGDVAAFADRCWNQWASFQSSNGKKLDSRQHAHSIEQLQTKYQEFVSSGGEALVKPLKSLTVTSPMSSSRKHPVTGEVRPHEGADYACALGEPVFSPIAGTFRRGNPDPTGFGNSWGSVEGNNRSITVGHTRKLLVNDGEQVKAGQPIAECGNEGTGSGPHLHLEIRQHGQLVNPEQLLK